MELEPQATSLLPSQQQLMLRIQHLAGLDSNLVIIAGRKGAGKETLSSAIVEHYSADFDVAWLPLKGKNTDSVIRSQILNQLFSGTVYDPDEPLQHSISQILNDQPSKQLIVLNHSEQLSNQLLVELWSVVENSRKLPAGTQQISVLLFAEPAWANRVSREMTAITESDQPVIQIPPLPLEERKQLFAQLKRRLEQEHVDADLFERQLNDQDGLPGEVVALCSADKEPEAAEQQIEIPAQLAPSSSSKIISLGIAAMAIFIALILWWAFSENETSEQTGTGAVEFVDLPLEASVETSEASEQQVPAESEKQSEQLPQLLPSQTYTAKVEDESAKQRVDIDEATLALLPETEAESSKQITPQEPIKETGQAASEQQLDASNLMAAQSQQDTENAEVEVISTLATDDTPAVPALEPAPWWQQLDSNRYVLQLSVMSSQAGLTKFAERYGIAADPEFKRYATSRNGKVVYIGVYGNYLSPATARSAILSLPESVQNLKPWPKSVAAIQKEVITP